jgi:DNA helicase II / ATP-dependent DNA helicase PcrA
MKDFIPNPRQKDAIEHVEGPMLVVAGAGTGKTSVLVERIARLVANGDARPDEILAVTYTRNAAAEMRCRVSERVRELGHAKAGEIRTVTFHGYCMEILQRCHAAFAPLTDEDLYVYLGRRLDKLQLRYYTRALNPAEFLRALNDFFSRCHDELVTASDYRAYLERLHAGERPLPRVVASSKADGLEDAEVLARCDEIARVYETVERWLAEDGLGTFGHMTVRAVELLRGSATLLGEERRRARFLLIDEFQDANFGQIELATMVAGKAANIFGVGDPDQAIYSFRGASNAAFEEFTRRFPQARGVVLDDNQRSRTPILRCAFSVLKQNPLPQCRAGNEEFHRTPLKSAREQNGTLGPALPVEIATCQGGEEIHTEQGEAAFVARAMQALRRKKPASRPQKPRFAVLYRARTHPGQLLHDLAKLKIPFSVTGVDVLQTAAVRELLACMRVIANPADVEALFRVAALPQFALDGEAVREALQSKTTAFETALRRLTGGPAVLRSLDQVRSAVTVAHMDALAAVDIAIAHFGFNGREPTVAALRDFIRETWKKKPDAIVGGGDLASLLDYLDWFADGGGTIVLPDNADDNDFDRVRLMTVHAAKGLEFEHVFVLRLHSGLFPTNYRERLFEFPEALRRSLAAQGESREVHRQEERRLFYVAITRARESLVVCTRPGSNKRRRPTAFVGDLLDDAASRPFRHETIVVPPAEQEHLFDIAAAEQPAVGLHAWLLAPPSLRLLAPTLSATSVGMYEKCPLRFKLTRDWNIPGPPAAALEYGKVMHSVLKDIYDAMRAGRKRTVEETIELFRREMKAAYFDDPHQCSLYHRQGEAQLTAFLVARAQEPPPEVVGTEIGFDIKIGSVVVKGRVDRMDRVPGGLAVIDYKTGSARKQKDADDSLQLSLYALAVKEKFGEPPARLLIYNLEDAGVVSTERNPAKLEKARERVMAAAEGIAAGHFEPKPEIFTCRWCEYRSLCPATEQKVYAVAAAVGAAI